MTARPGQIRVIHAGVGGRGRWPLEVLGADSRFRTVALVDVAPASLAAARATAVSHNAPWSAYTHDAGITAVLEFRAGPVCTYQLTHQATLSEYRFILQSEQGALVWEDRPGPPDGAGQPARRWRFYPRPDRQLGRNPAPVEIETLAGPRSEQGVVDDWHRAIASPSRQTEIGISGRRNLETLAVCEMVVRSATERRPVAREEL